MSDKDEKIVYGYKNRTGVYSSNILYTIPTINSKNSLNDSKLNTSVLSASKKKTTIQDFERKVVLGKGSYGKVELVTNINTGKTYALKILDKTFMKNQKKEHEVMVEKACLAYLSHPNIIKLGCTFTDKRRLYIGLEYCSNRDLGTVLKASGLLDDALVKFYAAEILSALTYMHGKGVYHRDLKPENIGVNDNFHLKILDFGTANFINKYYDKNTHNFVSIVDPEFIQKINQSDMDDERDLEEQNQELEEELKEEKDENEQVVFKDNDDSDENISNDEGNLDDVIEKEMKKKSAQRRVIITEDFDLKFNNYLIKNLKKEFVGTAEYVSPEVLNHQYELIGPPCDLWAYGVILYLLLHGKTPFKGKSEELTFENIKQCNYQFNNNIPEEAKDLISKLLVLDPNERIGIKEGNYDAIKNHPYFKDIDFNKLSTMNPPVDKIKFKNKLYGKIEDRHSYNPNTNRTYNKLNDSMENRYSDSQRFNNSHNTNNTNNNDSNSNNSKGNENEANSNNNSISNNSQNSGNVTNTLLFLNNNLLNKEDILDTHDDNNNSSSLNKKDSIDSNKQKDDVEEKKSPEETNGNLNEVVDPNSKEAKFGKIILEDMLLKKSPWLHWNSRFVKLYAKGFFEYIDPKKNKTKGIILLNEYCKVEIIDEHQFNLYTEDKKFLFKHKTKNIAREWHDKIIEVIKNRCNVKKC